MKKNSEAENRRTAGASRVQLPWWFRWFWILIRVARRLARAADEPDQPDLSDAEHDSFGRQLFASPGCGTC